VLESRARSYTLPYWQVIRAQMVLLAGGGHGPCAAQASQWINGFEGLNFDAYHPNVTGNQQIADLLYSLGVQNWAS
jgi:hypothetical protein